jgi:phosphoenolpyruvate-protein kinase (PTS system EI component)
MNADDTSIRLKEYIEAILNEREKALKLTAHSLEQRLEHLNALRDQVLNDRSQFVNQDVYKEMHEALIGRVDKLEATISKIIGVGSALIVVSGLIGAFITHIFK